MKVPLVDSVSRLLKKQSQGQSNQLFTGTEGWRSIE
jgi:hypothetical protein